MRTFSLFSILLLACSIITAQSIRVVHEYQLKIPSRGSMPVLNPNGDKLLLSGGDLTGLTLFDLQTQEIKEITTGNSAGFDARFTNDGAQVVFRNSFYKDKLRYVTLKSLNIESGKEKTLIKKTRNLEGLNIVDGTVLAIDNSKVVKKKVSGKSVKSADLPAVASIKQGKLYVTNAGKIKLITPSDSKKSYLWASVSPNGKKLVYYEMQTAKAYVSNIDGSNPVSLGVLRAPTWLGNDWIVGMLDFDDGHVVTSSQLIAVSAAGGARTVLTPTNIIALNPSASVDGKKIAYNTAGGEVFLIEVETTK